MQSIYRKIIKVLNVNQKRNLIFIFFLILIGVFLEILGIGMIIPLMNVIVNNDLSTDYPKLIPLLNFLGNPNNEQLIFYSMGVLLIIYALKNFFLGYLTWKKSKFTFSLFADLSNRLLKIYLKKDYNYHVEKNSADLVRNVLSETRHFGKGFILSSLDVLVESLVLISVILLLILVEPIGAIISISIFSTTGYLYYFINKKKLTKYGEERQFYEGKKIKYLNEIFDNIKIISLLGKESKLLKDFNIGNNITAEIGKKQNFIQQLPRLFFEFLAIFLFCILVFLSLIFKRGEIQDIIPTLGIFAAATFRILPSINKILVNSQTIRFSKSAIDLIYNEFSSLEKSDKESLQIKKSEFKKLKLINVNFKYPRDENFLLSNINLEIEAGKTYGFVGASGVGKSSLMDLLMCIQKPTNGEIILNENVNIFEYKKSWQKIIGYVPQNVFLTDNTIMNNIAFGENNDEIDKVSLKESITSSQLETFIESLDNKILTVVGENGLAISGGQRQRIGIARALYVNPEILILDEITSALDVVTENKIIEELNSLKGKKTILIITHRTSATKFCDEIYKIENTKLKKMKNV
jgi:ABC-type multidrug transport system fused ATPase/permease subunit